MVPILLDAMAVVAKERLIKRYSSLRLKVMYFHRPNDPIEFVAAYLLKHKERYQQ